MLGISDHNGPSHAVWVCGWASLDRKSLHIFLLLVPIVVLLLTLQHTLQYQCMYCIAYFEAPRYILAGAEESFCPCVYLNRLLVRPRAPNAALSSTFLQQQ